jgi:hypothetical protein
MQVANRQREEFAKRARMLDDAENGPRRAMPAEAALAPLAMPTGQIDFAYDAFPDPRFVGGLRYLAHELVTGRTGESVVSALKFEIGGADSGREQANPGESLGYARQRLLANLHAPGFEVNG